MIMSNYFEKWKLRLLEPLCEIKMSLFTLITMFAVLVPWWYKCIVMSYYTLQRGNWGGSNTTLRQKFKGHQVFFLKLFFLLLRTKEVEHEMLLFGNILLWIRSQATIWVVFEDEHEIKLLIITRGKKELTQTF